MEIINKTINDDEELGFYDVVLVNNFNNEVSTNTNFNVGKSNILVQYIEHCVEFMVEENKILFLLERKLLKNKSCYSLAELLVNVISKLKHMEIYIQLITPTGLVTVYVSGLMKDSNVDTLTSITLAGVLSYLEVIVNNDVVTELIGSNCITFRTNEELSNSSKVVLEEFLTNNVILTKNIVSDEIYKIEREDFFKTMKKISSSD